MDPSRGRAERRGRCRRALEPDLLAHAPDKNHLMLERRAVQAPQRDELRGRTDAVVERPARRAGPREADALLWHGYRLPRTRSRSPGVGGPAVRGESGAKRGYAVRTLAGAAAATTAVIAPPSIAGFPGPAGPHRRGLPSRPPCRRSAPAAPRS